MRSDAAPLRFRHECHSGAEPLPEGGARFRLWAPDAPRVELLLGDSVLPMQRADDGTHEIVAPQAQAGMTYAYRVDDGGPVPDPASRAQVGDVEGPSRIVDPLAYTWRTGTWHGLPWSQAVICEVHVGTCGGFAGLREQLPRLAAAGYTAIELMPIAEFPGARNWGYDGVLPYAPESSYGTPDELKALVDAAHELGLMLLLDVVYNHFGPRGNALRRYASAQLATVLAEGFAFQGQRTRHGQPRGEPSAHLPPTAFVLFAQNHDQIGNRPLGERLSTLTSVAAMRAATALVALTPMIPLFFMGDEWGCRTPFLFFTDYQGELARKVSAGRREEFKAFFAGSRRAPRLPDPNTPTTYDKSLPRVHSPIAAQRWSTWFTQLLLTRRKALVPALDDACAIDCQVLGTAAVVARWRLGDGRVWELAANLGPVAARILTCDEADRPVYAVPARAGAARCAGELPPYSVVVRVSATPS